MYRPLCLTLTNRQRTGQPLQDNSEQSRTTPIFADERIIEMIVIEFYRTRNDGVNLFRTYSDEGCYMLQVETGLEYAEAIDVENAPYTYTETDRKEVFVEEEMGE